MKKENFDFIFKIIVLIQLTAILTVLIFSLKTSGFGESENGRYREMNNYSPPILDTKTGKIINR